MTHQTSCHLIVRPVFICSFLIIILYTSGSRNCVPGYAPGTLLVFFCALATLLPYLRFYSSPRLEQAATMFTIGALRGSCVWSHLLVLLPSSPRSLPLLLFSSCPTGRPTPVREVGTVWFTLPTTCTCTGRVVLVVCRTLGHLRCRVGISAPHLRRPGGIACRLAVGARFVLSYRLKVFPTAGRPPGRPQRSCQALSMVKGSSSDDFVQCGVSFFPCSQSIAFRYLLPSGALRAILRTHCCVTLD